MAFVSWKDRKRAMPGLKAIYRAESAAAAAAQLDAFEAEWGSRYPAVAPAWRRAWEHVVPMFAFPPAIRKMMYTTNTLESLHRSLRKIIKTRGSPQRRSRPSCSRTPGCAGTGRLIGPRNSLPSVRRSVPGLSAEAGNRHAQRAAYTG